jgi:hypothetical protein
MNEGALSGIGISVVVVAGLVVAGVVVGTGVAVVALLVSGIDVFDGVAGDLEHPENSKNSIAIKTRLNFNLTDFCDTILDSHLQNYH